jgi:hypothetical protein
MLLSAFRTGFYSTTSIQSPSFQECDFCRITPPSIDPRWAQLPERVLIKINERGNLNTYRQRMDYLPQQFGTQPPGTFNPATKLKDVP